MKALTLGFHMNFQHNIKASLLSLFILSNFNQVIFANNSNGDLNTSATIENHCQIAVEDISFGILVSPLMAQTKTGNMNVLCNKNTAYSINLTYGGIYGTPTAPSDYYLKYISTNTTYLHQSYDVNKFGLNIGIMYCYTNGDVYFSSKEIAGAFGYTNALTQADTRGACVTNGTLSGTKPSGWVGAYNASGVQAVAGKSYDYGMMTGLTKGDSVAYSIELPSDTSKSWNISNFYNSSGSGSNQTIPVKVKIVPDRSSKIYPAQDNYLDTLTATINY